MTGARFSLLLAAWLVATGSLPLAQAQTHKPSETLPPGKNPHLGNKGSIKSGMTAKTDGIVGLHVNHLLDVHIEGFEIQKR